MELDEWIAAAPPALRAAPVWKVRAYQIGAYIGTTAAEDATALEAQPRFARVAPQLVTAAGSISAHIGEGYSRLSRRERIKFYEYALGSANESSSWYNTAAAALPPGALDLRLASLARVSQLLVKMIQNERIALQRNSPKRIA
jgi:four helix bundle protein